MMCYKDRTFCGSKTHKPDCDRQFTDADQVAAERWWGNKNAPVAFSNFCDDEEKPVRK